jgi:excisionase family DNA binding protein
MNLIPSRTPGSLRLGLVRIRRGRRGVADGQALSPLLDAKAAGRLLGVPHTWLLAQARAGLIPHHRLGHYVRFDAQDLATWLRETRRGPAGWGDPRAKPGR